MLPLLEYLSPPRSLRPLLYILIFLLLPLLLFLSFVYLTGVKIRILLFEKGVLKRERMEVPVISVGNISTGGTGKTPLVIHLAGRLKEMGWSPAVLSLGYGRKRKKGRGPSLVDPATANAPLLFGDEPLLIALNLPGVPVCLSSDRGEAGRFVLEKVSPRPDIFILDDGFSLLELERDLDILLMDPKDPLEGRLLLPLGRLREPPSSIKRADVVSAVMREGDSREVHPLFSALSRRGVDIFRVEIKARAFYTFPGMERAGENEVRAGPAFLFSGIARPASFRRMVEGMGVEVAGFKPFRDHHRFSRRDIERLEKGARRRGAEVLITTEKDAVRLRGTGFGISLYYLKIRVETRGEEGKEMADFISETIRKGRG